MDPPGLLSHWKPGDKPAFCHSREEASLLAGYPGRIFNFSLSFFFQFFATKAG
jgi:hypothetical protein